jgi:Xaa-Pro dipeptidase
MFQQHLQYVRQSTDAALQDSGHDGVLIYANQPRNYFLDDMPWPFKPNPHFAWWVPEASQYPHSFLHYRPGQPPELYLYQPRDYWHSVPAAPEGDWADSFVLRPFATDADLPDFSRLKNHAFIGQADASPFAEADTNPAALLNPLHWHRSYKTGYEVEQILHANKRALAGHRAARDAFYAGKSEFETHLDYLRASGHAEAELPYGNIIAQNAHAAVLHYQQLLRDPFPDFARYSFLIDAGAQSHGYAADITRSYAWTESPFDDLIEALDAAQQKLVARAVAGQSYVALHEWAHALIGDILNDFGIISLRGAEAAETGLTQVFFPHGLGHFLGLQVHDVGGKQADAQGTPIPQPEKHPYLRLLRPLEAGHVLTIEPGIYFIPLLLDEARNSPLGQHIHWNSVEHFLPFGGIRIEDNVRVGSHEAYNLTRSLTGS